MPQVRSRLQIILLSVATLLLLASIGAYSTIALADDTADGESLFSTTSAAMAFGNPSGWQGAHDRIAAGLTRMQDHALEEASSADDMAGTLGIDAASQLSGIGGYFLNVMFGSSLLADVVNGTSQEGPTNFLMGSILKFATVLGVAVAIVFGVAHAITMFFSYLEYGDILGEARERMIGGFRAVITIILISPIATGGLAPAQFGAIWASATSNGMGNRLAFIVAGKGFGDPSSGGSIFSIESSVDADPQANARAFTEMVGAESCRRQMSAMGMPSAQVASACGRVMVSASDETEAYSVPIDDAALSDSSIEASCDNVGASWGGETYIENVCVNVRHHQRDAQQAIEDLFATHGGDISTPEAQDELQAIADTFTQQVHAAIQGINTSICEATDASCDNPVAETAARTMGGSNTASAVNADSESAEFNISDDVVSASVVGQEFQSMVLDLGWPGLALIYSSLGDRIDAVSRIQNNGTDSAGWTISDNISNSSQHMTRVIRQVQRDSVLAGAAASAAGERALNDSLADNVHGVLNWMGDLLDDGSIFINELAQDGLIWLLDPLFSKPAPAATYELGARVIGTLLAAAAAHDFMNLTENLPFVGAVSSSGMALAESVSNALGSESEAVPFGSGSLILYALLAGLGLLIVFILLMSAFLVFVLPKLPILIVGLLLAEWAIWCAIITWGSTLWVAINLSSLTNSPHLGTMAFLRGLGVVMYLLLYPVLVVIAIVVSVVIYNLLVPTLAMLLMGAFGMGFVDSVVGIFALPFVVLFAVAIAAFVSVSAISRVPDMINGMLGMQAPGQSVSGHLNSFIGGPQNYNNATGPMDSFRNAMRVKSLA